MPLSLLLLLLFLMLLLLLLLLLLQPRVLSRSPADVCLKWERARGLAGMGEEGCHIWKEYRRLICIKWVTLDPH